MRSFIAKTSACEKKGEVSFVFEQNAGIRNNAIRLFVTKLVGVEVWDASQGGKEPPRLWGTSVRARAIPAPRFYLIDIQPHLSCLARATFHLPNPQGARRNDR